MGATQILLRRIRPRACVFVLWTIFVGSSLLAQPAPPTNQPGPLDLWAFANTNTWADGNGNAPVSFTNLGASHFDGGNAVVVDSTSDAWLRFDVFEGGQTNLTVSDGTVLLWFSSDWNSVNQGGAGPGGQYASLFEAGLYTSTATVGWWSIYMDSNGNNLYFSAQTNSGLSTNYAYAPISWTNGLFHMIAVTYTPTNSQIYIDGTNAANGPGVTIYPNNTVLSNGLWIGSASNGVSQCHGAITAVETYGYALDSNAIASSYFLNSIFYAPSKLDLNQGPSEPETVPTFDAVTGPGYLVTVSSNSGCGNNTNVWITNTTAVVTNNAVNLTFTIAGGSNGLAYDVFATAWLTMPITNGTWTWMGQGYQCCTYTIPDLTNDAVFLILGTPLDQYGNGLTDAYELLVLHKNPAVPSGDGMLDGWKVLWGMNPAINNSAQPSERYNYTYDGTGRLETNSGVSYTGLPPELFGFDSEGNIQSDQP